MPSAVSTAVGDTSCVLRLLVVVVVGPLIDGNDELVSFQSNSEWSRLKLIVVMSDETEINWNDDDVNVGREQRYEDSLRVFGLTDETQWNDIEDMIQRIMNNKDEACRLASAVATPGMNDSWPVWSSTWQGDH